MIIEQPARFLRWIYPHAVWRMDPSEKTIYLTFDDGPIPEATPFILQTLRQYGIKATFFVVGDNVRKYPDLLRQIASEGHRIGNHTFNHIGGLRRTCKEYLDNTKKAQQIILETLQSDHHNPSSASMTNKQEKLFRPPHGWMRTDQYRMIRRQGYQIILWDLVTRDYSRRLTAQDVLDNVKRLTRPGSIVTFHDSLRSISKLQKVLPEALEWLLSQGYVFKTFP